MKFKDWLVQNYACEGAREWVGDKTLQEAWATCTRGDWMKWLSRVADYHQPVLDDVLTEKWNEFRDDNKVEEAFTAAYRTMRKEAGGRDPDSVWKSSGSATTVYARPSSVASSPHHLRSRIWKTEEYG